MVDLWGCQESVTHRREGRKGAERAWYNWRLPELRRREEAIVGDRKDPDDFLKLGAEATAVWDGLAG